MLDLSAFKAAQLKILDDLGLPCHYRRAKDDVQLDIVAGFKSVGVKDQAITLSFGVTAKIITLKASDFTIDPAKYDEFKFDGNEETYIADTIVPIHIGAEVVFFKAYIRGK